MRRSTLISAALHTAILLWVVAAFPTTKLNGPPLEEIPVDLAAPSDLTKIKAGTEDAKDEAPLKAKPKEKKSAAVTEKPPEETAAVPPPPAPQEKAEKAPEPKPKKAEKPKEPKAPKKAEDDKPKKPKKPALADTKHDFNTDKIAALLNKIPNAAAEQPEPAEIAEEAPEKTVQGQSNGGEMTMSVNEIDALRARIAQCWSPPPGGLGAEEIVVKLRLKLNEDGTLVGYPTVANSGSSPFFQAAADSAVRAVYQCQPYSLPSDKYALWRDMILNFDPSDMYRAG